MMKNFKKLVAVTACLAATTQIAAAAAPQVGDSDVILIEDTYAVQSPPMEYKVWAHSADTGILYSGTYRSVVYGSAPRLSGEATIERVSTQTMSSTMMLGQTVVQPKRAVVSFTTVDGTGQDAKVFYVRGKNFGLMSTAPDVYEK